MKALLLVDGEHYPPVTRWAVEVARERGLDPVAALLVGGGEKLAAADELDLGIPVTRSDADRSASLRAAIAAHRPGAVLDLSDEPVLGYRERMELVAVALVAGLPYLGPDFRLDPPIEGPALPVPTAAVIGTGKRTGKTAIAGEVARVAASLDLTPILVAMGRGGPPKPQVAEAGSVDLPRLIDLRRRGEHAASDYLEDALMAGVTTIGARRAGGGLAGRPFATNVREAADLAVGLGAGVVILEGSGSAVPPIPWDVGILVVPATAPPEYLGGYLGPYRLLLSDLVVFTMGTSPSGLENLPVLRSHVQRFQADARQIITDFIPVPLADVRGRRAFFITTAPEPVAARQVQHLEAEAGCRVVGWSARLADRAGLAEDLEAAERYDVLLTELKAAAVDIGVEQALARGAEVVFVDNRATVVEGSTDLRTAIAEALELAMERGSSR
ncbi:MAG TPA: 2,3-diphosphoglycerate synthetase [Actinomycetota bacterium]|jgi:cyclic 2,3-diphosphoglycerate synthetase|nr:2,3-diphosphoglycerate synthetase [Actinomycetota bacterium]